MKSLGILFVMVFFNSLLILCIIINNNCGSEMSLATRSNNHHYVIHGKWKPGRRLKQTCNFIMRKDKCCEEKQKDLHFEFHDPRLNTINPLKELRKILKHKKLLLIGDSLMLEFFRGLAEMMHVKSAAEKGANYSGSIYPGGRPVSFLGAGVILLKGRKDFPAIERFRITSENTIREKIADHDIIFFNQGVHYGGKLMLNESIIYFNNMGEMLHGKNF